MVALTWILAGAGSALTDEPPSSLDRFLEENGLLVGAIAFVVLMAFGFAWTAAAYHRSARQRAMQPTARKHGLAYSRSDPFGSTTVAFPLLGAGDGRTVENVMWRDGDGVDARVFDYSYYEERTDENGRVHRSYRHYTCALARHNGLWPTIRVVRERALDRVAQRVGLPDIELESEDFNRTFLVQCEDRRFATDLLAPEMMEFLLTTQGLVDFETKGRWLLLTAKRLPAADLPGLLGVADQFLRHIPPLVWDLYPKAPDAPGGGLPVTEEGTTPVLDQLSPSVGSVLRDEVRERRAASSVEYDLDGNPVAPVEEDPWR